MVEINVYHSTEFTFVPGQSSHLIQGYLALSLSKRRLETGSEVEYQPEHIKPFLHIIKKYQREIRNDVYVYSDIFTMVIDISRQIVENFSKSQMAGS